MIDDLKAHTLSIRPESAARRAVLVLRRLNRDRAKGESLDAEAQLEALDDRGGYLRDISRDDAIPEGQRTQQKGKQRNPEWRAALDKLNAMRGRTR